MTDSNWLNICVDCGNRMITRGPELPGQCPGCHGWRWLCHLQTPIEKDSGGYQDSTPEFCPPILDALVAKRPMDKNTATPPDNGGKRGRPRVMIPDDLIQQLSGEGLGAMRIADKLKEQGIEISYKTIQRRLQASLL